MTPAQKMIKNIELHLDQVLSTVGYVENNEFTRRSLHGAVSTMLHDYEPDIYNISVICNDTNNYLGGNLNVKIFFCLQDIVGKYRIVRNIAPVGPVPERLEHPAHIVEDKDEMTNKQLVLSTIHNCIGDNAPIEDNLANVVEFLDYAFENELIENYHASITDNHLDILMRHTEGEDYVLYSYDTTCNNAAAFDNAMKGI